MRKKLQRDAACVERTVFSLHFSGKIAGSRIVGVSLRSETTDNHTRVSRHHWIDSSRGKLEQGPMSALKLKGPARFL